MYFDLGGVIFYDIFSGGESKMCNYLGLSKNNLLRTYVKTDIPEYSLNNISDFDRWKLFTSELGIKTSKIETLINHYHESYQLIIPTINFIRDLKQRYPKLRIGILSDQPKSVVERLRDTHKNVFSLFENNLILFSSEVGLSKRDSAQKFFKYALNKTKIPNNQILYIDDSKKHIQQAEKVGLIGFHFNIKKRKPISIIKELRYKVC